MVTATRATPVPIAAFRVAMADHGITPPVDIQADGDIHRFSTNGKNGDTSGWYVLHLDNVPAGAFGDWRQDISQTWCGKSDTQMSSEEKDEHRKRIEAMKQQRDAEREQAQAEAAEKAAKIWAAAETPQDHPYLSNKGIIAHGISQHGESLVIPVRDGGNLLSLQFIDNQGNKRFLTGGKTEGGYFSIGKPENILLIAEGYATAATLYEATGHAVAAAFNAGNVLPVAKALRAKLPDIRIVICGDNDESNIGQKKANEAAEAIGDAVAIPPDLGDWNDYAQEHGAAALRASLESVTSIEPPITYRRLWDIESVPIRWLWPGRIARGKPTIIAGDPGLGKSQITTSITAIVTTGGRWPVDRTKAEVANVIILSAEDDAGDTIKPRLLAAGVDESRVFVLGAVPVGDSEREFQLGNDIPRLNALMDRIGDVGLVIIDPISAYMHGTDSHKNSDVRALLSPLTKLAAQKQAAVICISHFNKGGSHNALSRVTGSLAFVAASRTAYIVTRDPNDEARRLFLPAKNNIGPDTAGLAYRVEPVTVNGDIETCQISWDSEPVTVTADDALSENSMDDDAKSERDDAADWLRDTLSDGPMPAVEIFSLGQAAGHSKRTLQRVRRKCKVTSTREGFGKDVRYIWSMDAMDSPSQNGGAHGGGGAHGDMRASQAGDESHGCHARQENGTGIHGAHDDHEREDF